jgi:hypothetical protein
MNIEKLNKMDACRHLLPEPGAEVVGELITELRKHRELLQECHDYLKARNLGKPAEELLVKCDILFTGC